MLDYKCWIINVGLVSVAEVHKHDINFKNNSSEEQITKSYFFSPHPANK